MVDVAIQGSYGGAGMHNLVVGAVFSVSSTNFFHNLYHNRPRLSDDL
jgi:hypothetical protein